MTHPRNRRPARMPDAVRIQKALADAGVASRRGADALVSADVSPSTGSSPSPGSAWTRHGRPGRRWATDRPGQTPHLPGDAQAGRRHQHRQRPPRRGRPSSTCCPRTSGAAGRGSTRWAASTRTREGLILLTDDGDWTQHLLHPRYGVEREYAVGLRRHLDDEQARRRSRRASSSTKASPRSTSCAWPPAPRPAGSRTLVTSGRRWSGIGPC